MAQSKLAQLNAPTASRPITASGNQRAPRGGAFHGTLTGDVSVHQGSQLLRGDFFTMDVQI